MPDDVSVSVATDPAVLGAVGDVTAQALGFPRELWERYVELIIGGPTNVRAVLSGGRVVGGLARIPGGQWYLGRSIPMVGIAAVGIAPEHRGRGLAARLCAETLRELSEAGVPLATLYASSLRVYRRTGFEPAGSRCIYGAAPRDLPALERDLPMTRVSSEDWAPLVPVDRALCAHAVGRIDRSPGYWRRLLRGRGEPVYVYVAGDTAAPEGYVVFTQPAAEGPAAHGDLSAREVAATTPRAYRRILTFLADHSSMVREVCWTGPARDPLQALLPEQSASAKRAGGWLLRVVDVERALAGRGYPPRATGELHLEVEDPLLERNRGRFILRVEGGRGEVTRGGAGALRCGIRGLAPLFTGLHTPETLARLGLVEGTVEGLETASGLFAGEEPWMPDMF